MILILNIRIFNERENMLRCLNKDLLHKYNDDGIITHTSEEQVGLPLQLSIYQSFENLVYILNKTFFNRN